MEEIIAPTIAFLAGLWLWSSRFSTGVGNVAM